MKNFRFAVLFSVVLILVVGCGGSVENQDCPSCGNECQNQPIADAGVTDVAVEAHEDAEVYNGCADSPYEWGDEVLYICAAELPHKEMNGFTFVEVASFQFVNYRYTWVNSITRVCVKNIGLSSLDDVTQINFSVVSSYEGPIAVHPPWTVDGKACADITITVGAESVSTLHVHINSWPNDLPSGAQYQFEIESPSDITNSDTHNDYIPIVGDFPVKSQVVTIIDG